MRELKPIDIGDVPELIRLIEEVRGANEPRVLQRGGKDVAILMPIHRSPRRRRGRLKTAADIAAFRSAAGSWEDVDTERLKEDIRTDRRMSDRPAIDL